MYVAAQQGHRELVTVLLTAGALVNAAGKGGFTPLHMTAEYGHRELAFDLLVAGADPETKCRIVGSLLKKSSIQLARLNHRHDIAQMLIDWRRNKRG